MAASSVRVVEVRAVMTRIGELLFPVDELEPVKKATEFTGIDPSPVPVQPVPEHVIDEGPAVSSRLVQVEDSSCLSVQIFSINSAFSGAERIPPMASEIEYAIPTFTELRNRALSVV
jgi:hypothetical protein